MSINAKTSSSLLIFLVLLSSSVSAKDFQVDSEEIWEEITPANKGNVKPKCANGDDYSFFYKESKKKSKDLMVFFNGGGACWDFDSCSSLDKTKYPINTFEETANLKYNKPGHWKGLLDLKNPKNPVQDWNVLVLPYCTGDLHAGSKVQTYTKGNESITIHHKGADNVRFAVQWLKDNKHDNYTNLLVAGSSSGGYGAMFNYDFIQKNISGKNRVVAIDAADAVVTPEFEKLIFNSKDSSWGFLPAYRDKNTSGTNFITSYNNSVIKRNKSTEFVTYSTTWDVMQILFFNIMKNKPDAWLTLDDSIRKEWKNQAENNRSLLLKNINHHMFIDTGCIHSGFRYDDSFYGTPTADHSELYEWMSDVLKKRQIKSIGVQGMLQDPKPNENDFGGCINRAVQSVQR